MSEQLNCCWPLCRSQSVQSASLPWGAVRARCNASAAALWTTGATGATNTTTSRLESCFQLFSSCFASLHAEFRALLTAKMRKPGFVEAEEEPVNAKSRSCRPRPRLDSPDCSRKASASAPELQTLLSAPQGAFGGHMWLREEASQAATRLRPPRSCQRLA